MRVKNSRASKQRSAIIRVTRRPLCSICLMKHCYAHGQVEDALAAAALLAAVEDGPHLAERARTLLPSIHRALHRAIFHDLLNLASPSHASELARIARLRGGEWASWVRAIRPALANCLRIVEPAHSALADCWHDLFPHGMPWPASVHQIVNIAHRDPSLAPGNLEPIQSKT
jgi:hypothetical protein